MSALRASALDRPNQVMEELSPIGYTTDRGNLGPVFSVSDPNGTYLSLNVGWVSVFCETHQA